MLRIVRWWQKLKTCKGAPSARGCYPRSQTQPCSFPWPLLMFRSSGWSCTCWGHSHSLPRVIRYPEAIPFSKATLKNIAKELILLFSRVGIPKDQLTNQGTPFVSVLITDLCWLLQVRHLQPSVCHPQTDGLVKNFNQTIKRMFLWVVHQEGHNWDVRLPYVLYAVQETPQAPDGFTLIELLFSRRHRGSAGHCQGRLGRAVHDRVCTG